MRNVLLRSSGAAAIVGGALRIAEPLLRSALTPASLSFAYFAIDVLLLFGIIGWYAWRADKLGIAGLAGFAIGVAGILVIRSASLFGAAGYQIGAAALLFGLAVMNAPALIRREGPVAPPSLWLASFMCGLASLVFAQLGVVAGVLFGLGYVLCGLALLRA